MMLRRLFGAAAVAAAVLILPAPVKADNVTFTYQGRVRVTGQPFSGTGHFKFAILNTSATATLWSNDGTLAGEPSASVPVSVLDGIVSVEVGGAGMTPLDQSIFATPTPLRLRTWFSDSGSSFEELSPDHMLNDLTLNTVQTGIQDYTIYVDGTNGNDAYNGLTTDTAKRTIGAAIDMIPARVRCNLTVKIFPGTYRESVGIGNIAVASGKTLTFLGDETWTRASSSNPNVRISASPGETAAEITGLAAFEINNCAHVLLKGLHFDGGSYGLDARNSSIRVQKCKATTCSLGMAFAFATVAEIEECQADSNSVVSGNGGYGYHVASGATLWLTNSGAKYNGFGGMRINHHCSVWLVNSSEFTDNTLVNLNIYSFGELTVYSGSHQVGRAASSNISLTGQSMIHNVANFTFVAGSPVPSLGNISKDSSSWTF